MLELLRATPFGTATWSDALDMALLSVVIYRVLLLLRASRAIQSLFGLALLAVLYAVSDLADLSAVHWVLDGLFVYLVIALLILFQDDIRRGLARAGGTVFTRAISRPVPHTALVEEMVRATFALAHRKIGALIVVQRRVPLEPFIESGRPLDARVSAELLQAIFHPSSPLHDGAVVIANDRVAAAGVFLPLSLSKDLSPKWGTRHRAAIGVCEDTDGLVVVVSEERGTVALVAGGQVVPAADVNDLRSQLVEHLGTDHA